MLIYWIFLFILVFFYCCCCRIGKFFPSHCFKFQGCVPYCLNRVLACLYWQSIEKKNRTAKHINFEILLLFSTFLVIYRRLLFRTVGHWRNKKKHCGHLSMTHCPFDQCVGETMFIINIIIIVNNLLSKKKQKCYQCQKKIHHSYLILNFNWIAMK